MSPSLDLLGLKSNPSLLKGRRRLKVLGFGFGLAFASVALRLVDMLPPQPAISSAEASDEAEGAEHRRPDILDRNGVLLATDLRLPSVFGDPLLIPNHAAAAKALAKVLSGTTAAELQERFDKARRFTWIKHQISPKEENAILQLGIPGIGFKEAEHRVYPKGRSAAHVLGFVDIDNKGLSGIEYGLDHDMAGPVDPDVPVRLSIDLRVQEIVADELGKAMTQFHPIGGCGLVLDRVTGEVLAMVSLPDYDLNYPTEAGPEQRRNRCSGGAYELGSLFKVVSHAMSLDTGKVTLKSTFDATGKLQIGRFRIGDDHAKNRIMSVPEIFMYSSNIGTARMAFAAGGGPALDSFLRKLGFYEKLPLEIPEVAKPMRPHRWPDITTATVSFGHGIAMPPLQYLGAVAGLAGDGMHVPVTLLKRDPDHLPTPTRFIQEKTAADLRSIMYLTVAKGTGTRGQVDGYLLGGKTGTADKAILGHKGYDHNKVYASFLAAFPIDNPRYLVMINEDEPKGDKSTYGFRSGAWVAAPAVGNIISRIAPLLGVPPSAPATILSYQDKFPQTRGMGLKSVEGTKLAAVGAED